MTPDHESRLLLLAEAIVRVGVNLQPGQPLLITEPYELQGVHPESASLVEAIRSVTRSEVDVVEADPWRLRTFLEMDDLRGFERLVSAHVQRMEHHLGHGGAFLFLMGSQPQLMSGIPAERLSKFARIKWRHLGRLIQRLVRGATQWTLVPAPSSSWADAAYADLPADERLPSLWREVFDCMRVNSQSPVTTWQTHLATLASRRDALNAARHRRIVYRGGGTDLSFELPRSHVWCSAQLTTKARVSYVVNLPTEEVFTAPDQHSATGIVRVARSITHNGSAIDGIELEFFRGRVVASRAATGNDLLGELLATDAGACRIGEVAIVGEANSLTRARRFFHHTLLDENAANHIALGDAYRFCSRAILPRALNSSQIHIDLPLDASVELI
jgi:aminopeptidase